MSRSIAFFLCLAFACGAKAAGPSANPLLGSWRLVAAIPGSMEDSSPNGVRNLRLRFGSDGKAVLVDPTETLAKSTTRNAYRYDGNTLTLGIGEGKELHGAVQSLPGDGLSITYAESGMTWSLRRIAEADIQSKKLAPESVEYFPPANLQAVESFKYDDADDSALAPSQRLIGQWEVVEISGYGGGDFPPYGAPNEVWQFDGKRVTRFSPNDRNGEHGMMYYSLRGPFLLFGGAGEGEGAQPTPYHFDEWHRLVVGDPQSQFTVMKRINRDGQGKVAMPPLRIILGYPRGGGGD
jgi:hypothetical protein